MASESGALPVNPAKVIKRGRLQPGKMFLVDLQKGKIINDEELKKEICTSQPYQEWLDENQIKLDELPEPRMRFTRIQGQDVLKFQKAFGYSREDIEKVIKVMAESRQRTNWFYGI